MREVVPLARTGNLPLGLAARAHEQPADQAEHCGGGGGDQRELEQEAAAGGGEDRGARAVDDDRPARSRGGRVGDDVVVAAVESADARDQADLALLQLPGQRSVAWLREAREQLTAVAVEDGEAA